MPKKFWLVLDMDDGVLRREPTRADALEWWMHHSDAPKVLERHTYGPGTYSYVVGYDKEDNSGSIFIERSDRAPRGGWNIHQLPLYPSDKNPHVSIYREEHVRETVTPMRDGEPSAVGADALLADCSCGDSYSVPAGPREFERLTEAHIRHVAQTIDSV